MSSTRSTDDFQLKSSMFYRNDRLWTSERTSPSQISVVSGFWRWTPLLHKDSIESTVCSHKKAVSKYFGIPSKGHSWIDPGDDIDFMAVPLWVRVWWIQAPNLMQQRGEHILPLVCPWPCMDSLWPHMTENNRVSLTRVEKWRNSPLMMSSLVKSFLKTLEPAPSKK